VATGCRVGSSVSISVKARTAAEGMARRASLSLSGQIETLILQEAQNRGLIPMPDGPRGVPSASSLLSCLPDAMSEELRRVAAETGFDAVDLVRVFTGAGLDALRRGEGVTVSARWGRPAEASAGAEISAGVSSDLAAACKATGAAPSDFVREGLARVLAEWKERGSVRFGASEMVPVPVVRDAPGGGVPAVDGAVFDLSGMAPADREAFFAKCRKLRTSPERQLLKLIKAALAGKEGAV
jgi:hypothetical protein